MHTIFSKLSCKKGLYNAITFGYTCNESTDSVTIKILKNGFENCRIKLLILLFKKRAEEKKNLTRNDLLKSCQQEIFEGSNSGPPSSTPPCVREKASAEMKGKSLEEREETIIFLFLF